MILQGHLAIDACPFSTFRENELTAQAVASGCTRYEASTEKNSASTSLSVTNEEEVTSSSSAITPRKKLRHQPKITSLLLKLQAMMRQPDVYGKAISWSADGSCVVVWSKDALMHVLASFFMSCKWTSFVCHPGPGVQVIAQSCGLVLMQGFHKAKQGTPANAEFAFSHAFFNRASAEDIQSLPRMYIRRCSASSRSSGEASATTTAVRARDKNRAPPRQPPHQLQPVVASHPRLNLKLWLLLRL